MLKNIVYCTAFLLCLAVPAATNAAEQNLQWSVQNTWSLPFTPIAFAQSLVDDQIVFILSDNARVHIYTAEGKKLGELPVEPGTDSLAVSPRGEKIHLLNTKTKKYSSLDVQYKKEVDLSGAPIRGKTDAPVTLILFSDFECNYCGKFEPVLRELLATNKDNLRIVFKHMPLSFHQYAEPAALASIAAQKQGKFWEMHDRLFLTKNWYPGRINDVAREIGLDMNRFNADYVSQETRKQLSKDKEDAQAAGINATPTVLINGWPVPDRSLKSLQAAINKALTNTPK